MNGNYSNMIKDIVNEYLSSNYNLNINTLDELLSKLNMRGEKKEDENKIYDVIIDGINFKFSDSVISKTVYFVSNELNAANEYDFKNLNFKKGDCVVDIGGNIGMVSIYLAKKYPFLKIYAFEPVRQNYENFKYNIKLNNIPDGTIFLENKAVTKDGRIVNMTINVNNTGGSSISDVISTGGVTQELNTNIESTTLKDIFKVNKIKKLRMLKIDCEGSEYEILQNTPEHILKNIQALRGEFHENHQLTDEYDCDDLYTYISKYISDIKVVKARGCFIM